MDEKVRIALVGYFQVGKSSCLNGLLTAKKAAVGNGWRSETAACTEYLFANGVVLVDTPGFDDTGERDQMTEKAIRRADCVLFVVDDQRYPDEVCVDWLWKLESWRKPTVFLLNCRDDGNVEEPVSPVDLEAFVERNGFDMLMPVRGEIVLPISANWDAPRNIDVLRAYLGNIRLELLSHYFRHASSVGKELADNFRDEFLSRFSLNHRVAV